MASKLTDAISQTILVLQMLISSIDFCPIQVSQINLINPLTHWGRDKIDAIYQTTFLNAFSWMKMY